MPFADGGAVYRATVATLRSWLVVGAALLVLAGAVAVVTKTDWTTHPPREKATRHVVFEATPDPPIAGEPPCYRMPGVNGASGTSDRGGGWAWEMLGSATQAQVAAVRECLSRDPRIGPISAQVVTAVPGGRK